MQKETLKRILRWPLEISEIWTPRSMGVFMRFLYIYGGGTRKYVGLHAEMEETISEGAYEVGDVSAPARVVVLTPSALGMEEDSGFPSSRVCLDIGGKKYTTTVDTLIQRDPNSMLAAMFSGRYAVVREPDTGVVFIDRDGKNFRHVLNWLRDGFIPSLNESEYEQLLREAEYYQLMGMVEHIKANLSRKKDEDGSEAELTRADIVKCIQSEKVRFRGLNLSGLDLSKLDLSYVDFSYSCIRGTFLSRAYLQCAKFRDADAEFSIFHNAILRECEFTGAKLRGALLAGANLQSANLQDACLIDCSFCGADLRSAHLQAADLTGANFEGANLEGANLKGAKVTGANFRGANLQRAYLRQVDLREAQMDGARLIGANTMGAIR